MTGYKPKTLHLCQMSTSCYNASISNLLYLDLSIFFQSTPDVRIKVNFMSVGYYMVKFVVYWSVRSVVYISGYFSIHSV